jgi:hypothetical protein
VLYFIAGEVWVYRGALVGVAAQLLATLIMFLIGRATKAQERP